MKKIVLLIFVMAMLLAGCQEAAEAPADEPVAEEAVSSGFGSVLQAVKDRGKLNCGVLSANPGFSVVDSEGNYTGFDIDMCKAIAIAVLGDSEAVELVQTTGETRFTLLQSGDIDVLVRSTTHTFTRDVDLGLNFAPPYLYDGQGIMVNKSLGFEKLEDLDGATICMGRGATTELNIADVMEEAGLTYTPNLFDDPNDVVSAFEQGRCDAMSNDKSGLSAQRTMTANPEDYVILDLTLSKEPLAPVVSHGDDQWFDIIRWVEYALWIAEEKGVTQANVDEMISSSDPEILRLLGVEEDMGGKLGLSSDWAYNMIKEMGNFAEIYDRHLGPDQITYIPRGYGNLYTNGGLVYPMPLR